MWGREIPKVKAVSWTKPVIYTVGHTEPSARYLGPHFARYVLSISVVSIGLFFCKKKPKTFAKFLF